ncbi:MAG: FecR domain-containing protein [Treponema sp.]|nr:FecR domain-containing protein [Treponema sp.]
MKRFGKIFIVYIFLMMVTAPIFAAEGVVTYVKGKVEVQRNSEWVPLNVGDKVLQSELVNTGFQSEAKIKLMESVLYLGPVTRVKLETLKSSSNTDKVNVYLATGSTRSKVEHNDSKRVNYTVRTAVAVASVRGTDWTMDSAGTVNCFEGGVAVALVSSLPAAKNASVDDSSEIEEEDEAAAEDNDSFEDSASLPTGGYLVSANQTITVTENATITSAVSNTSKTVSDTLSLVSSASTKEAVSSSTTSSAAVVEVSSPVSTAPVSTAPAQEPVTTGSVAVEITVE